MLIRSILFNVLFYLNLLLHMLLAMPTMVLPRSVFMVLVRSWARVSLWLLRVTCGIKVEWRGLEKLPQGAFIVASKHQSTWETFALITQIAEPTFILKRELMLIPLFGWCLWKGGMIPVDRGARAKALPAMIARAKAKLMAGRQIIIFPEGTRTAPGAEPRYKSGAAYLYEECGATCVPVALNSGLFWPRRALRRRPGTVIVEILDPIPPGLNRAECLVRMQAAIEPATARLVEEGRRELEAAGYHVPLPATSSL
jgi:1-acyl-sn-glycerol-3-phosphate acyltransferase